jgi:HAD superfamily hydrolase (TIGR01509 family)
MPGAAAAVERMAAAFPIALATNSNAADTGHVLDRFGLAHHFTAVVTREQYEEAKPAPDAFLAAVAALGVAPSRCLVVEDAERGVRAAHAAGIPCLAVPNAWTQDHDFALAISRVASLDDLTSARVEEWVDTEVAS